MDPGPGCIVQVNKRKLNPQELSAIIVSHRHLDHSADLNVMTEAMTDGGLESTVLSLPRGTLLSRTHPAQLPQKKHRRYRISGSGKTWSWQCSFTAPVRHVHMVENYGLIFKTKKHTIAYITDTRYFEELGSYYRGDLLMLNLTFMHPRTVPDRPVPRWTIFLSGCRTLN